MRLLQLRTLAAIASVTLFSQFSYAQEEFDMQEFLTGRFNGCEGAQAELLIKKNKVTESYLDDQNRLITVNSKIEWINDRSFKALKTSVNASGEVVAVFTSAYIINVEDNEVRIAFSLDDGNREVKCFVKEN